MKHILWQAITLVVILGSMLASARPTNAVCVPQSNCGAGKTPATYTLTYPSNCSISQNPFCSIDAQCTHPIYTSGTTASLCCDSATEANSVDSLRSPLCGASPEQGKTNATCWTCGGDIICNGMGFGTGTTSDSITNMGSRVAIGSSGDITQVWRVNNPPSSFEFNGQPYNRNDVGASGVVVCTSNVAACGITLNENAPFCRNILYPDVMIGGPNGDVPVTFEDACDGGDAPAGARCNIDGDKVNPVIELGETTKPCKESTDEETGQTEINCVSTQTHTREKIEDVLEWGLKDAGNFNLSSTNDMMEGARLPLTPKTLWDITVRHTNPQWSSWIARACDYSRQDDGPLKLERDEVSTERMNLGPDENINRTQENLEFLNAGIAMAKVTNQYYQKASELVKLATAYACGTEQEATQVQRGIKESQGAGRWDILSIKFITQLFDLTAKNMTQKRIYETARSPYSEEIAGSLVQADDYTFQYSRVSDGRKQRIINSGGLVETFRPCGLAFEPEEYDGEAKNPYLVVKEEYEQDSRFHLAKLIDNATNYLQATLVPASLQGPKLKQPLGTKPCGGGTPNRIPPNEAITSSESEEVDPAQCSAAMADFPTSLTSLSTAIQAATAGKIPSCVLEGVAANEGAAIEIESGKCQPNECGAAGPFQITVGFTFSTQNGQCSKDTKCKSCGAGHCPDAVKYYVPGTNPCDTLSAAKGAVSMLIGKANYYGLKLDQNASQDAIIAAGDSYYGAAIPVARFGGCSYGEQIYKSACGNSSYVCKPHALPTAAPLKPTTPTP